jgi:HAE1 family hydrophobic/amphiphilic exporter-1
MTTLAVAVFGFLAARSLPIDLLPNLSYPTLTIQTVYPDAAPVSVEQFVTRPVEEAVGVIPGVRDMRSVSRAGLSEVILEFEWSEAMDFAALDVREKLGLVELPREAELPRVLRYDPSLDPIMRLAFTGDRSLDDLRQLGERWLKPQLEAVLGVAAAKVRGGLDPEIQVEADERRLRALGLTLDDLARALEAENVNRPGGTLKDWGAVYLVRTLHEFDDLDQIRRTVVRETPQGRVRVEDVARVWRGHRDREEITRSEGEEAVEIALHREGAANTIVVAGAIREKLAEVRPQMAEDLKLVVLTDQSRYIAEAVGQVWTAALIGGILAILVLFFFLRDPLSTLIVALTIPISVVAVFLPLKQAGVSLNIMSLGGLALGVGMLVDNSIVVLEAIDRRRREGRSRRDAAVTGASEVAGAVVAATLTTVCVFLPIVFVQGVAGQLFYDLAVTVCLSLMASLIVSLTVIPTLSAFEPGAMGVPAGGTLFRWDRGAGESKELPWTLRLGPMVLPPLGNGVHWFSRVLTVLLLPLRLVLALALAALAGLWWAVSWLFHLAAWPLSRFFDGVGVAYSPALRGALRLRWVVLPVGAALFALALSAVPRLGMSLVPDLSQGEFAYRLRLAEGTPLETTAQVVERIEAPLLGDPRFARIFSLTGSLPSSASGRQTIGENLSQINFVLAEGAAAEAEQVALARVREVLALFPEVEAELVRPSVLTVRPPVAVRVFSDDLDALDRGALGVERALREVPGLQDVASTVEPGSPEIQIELDRERAGALGVQAEMVGTTLRRQIRGEVVGQFREGEERLDIRLRATADMRNRASEIESLPLRLPDGTVVPVSAVAHVIIGRGPASIQRSGGARVAEVTARAAATDLGGALEEVEGTLFGLDLPAGVVAEMAGQDKEMQVSFDSLRLALALALFLVYVVMASQFESLVHPFVIFLSVPLGIVGVVLALLLTGTTLSVLVFIGAVMLAGIVVNNAIVLVDAVNRRRRREGQGLDEAIVGAGRERLRPILMTTTTTVLALLPMALGLGAGDELRAPLAITVIGGLSVATLLTLIVVPSLYRILSRRQPAAESETEEAAPAPAAALPSGETGP